MRPRDRRRSSRSLVQRAGFAAVAALLTGTFACPSARAVTPISFLPPVTYDLPGGAQPPPVDPVTYEVLGAVQPVPVDLDGDGKMDLVVAGPQGLSFFYGRGDGTLEPRIDLPMTPAPCWTIAADLNGDGLPDLVTTQGNSVLVMMNQGDGRFARPVAYPVGTGPSGITAADFNHDGKLDLAVANGGSNNMCVLLNKGDGTFGPAVFYPGGQTPARLVSADFNGDGNPDLAMSNFLTTDVIVYFGDGRGGFTVGADFQSARENSYPAMILTADFNGDGKPDIATANLFDNSVSVFLGDGRGHFGGPAIYRTIQYPHIFAAADLDGDGYPDIAAPNNDTGLFTVLQNKGDGTGTFLPAVTFSSGGNNTRLLAIADLNGDGLPDVITGNESSNSISVLINNTPRSSPTQPATAPTPGPRVRLGPNTPEFGLVFAGSSSAPQSVTVTNSGSTPLTLGSVTLSGADPGDFAVTPSATTIAPGDKATLSIAFTPAAVGPRSALLTIADNAGDSPLTMNLTGTAAPDGPGTVTLLATDSSTPGFNDNRVLVSVDFRFGPPGIRGLVKFDTSTIPTGAVVTGAILRTYMYEFSGYPAVDVYRASSDQWSRGRDILPPLAELLTPVPRTDQPQPGDNTHPDGAEDWNLDVDALDWSSVLSQGALSLVLQDYNNSSDETYRGSDPGPYLPTLTVSYESPAVHTPAPRLGVSTNRVSFGDQPVGLISAAQTLTLTNTGDLPLSIGGITLQPGSVHDESTGLSRPSNGAFAIASDSGETVLAPGASRTVTVTFTPHADASLYYAALSIQHNDPRPGAVNMVGLTGSGVVPAETLSASSVSFGSQRVGTTSDEQTVTIGNTGAGPLIFQGVHLEGANVAEFSVPDLAGVTVAPGENRTVGLHFTPTARGSRSATLVITDNAPDSPHRITLTGTGTAPVLRLSPTALDFGPQPVGLNGPLAVLLQNTGDAPLQVGSIAFQGPNASDFSLATDGVSGHTLQPGDIGLLNIRFSPSTTGSRSASLVISDDAADNPQFVPLTGTGTAPLLTLSADSLIFGLQPAGDASAAQTLTLTNTGDAPLTIEGLTLAGPDAGSFHVVNDSGEKSLAVGARRTLTIAFSPATIASRRRHAWGAAAHIAAVSYSATLVIRDNDPHPGAPHSVTLTAVETAPAAPTNLAATLTPADQVALTWTTHSSSATAFAIWRQTGGGAFVRVGVVTPKTTHFTDTGVRPNTAYTYEVRAINNSGASAWSNKATAVTLEAPPAAPANLAATVVSGGEIDLTWTRGGGDETGIAIFRRTGTGGWQRIRVVAPSATRYADRSVQPGTSYSYQVRAHNNHYVSAWTNAVSGLTPPAP